MLERSPFQPRVVAAGVAAGLALALLAAVAGWPLAAATPIESEVGAVARVDIGGESWLTRLATALSHAGHLVPVAAVAVIAAAVARWRWGRWDLGLLLLVVLGGASAVTGTVKLLTSRARPDEAVVETLSSAYPSGHAVRAVAVYGLLTWLVLPVVRRTWSRLLAVAVGGAAIGLNALARVALGAHWPTDVLVGLAVGAAWLSVAILLLRPRPATLRAAPGDAA